jgi:hypothetical protein
MKMMAILGLLATVTWVVGCGRSTDASEADGGGTDVDVDTDANGDAGTDSDTDSSSMCPDAIAETCSGDGPGELSVSLQADEFGQGFHFVKLGHESLIGERTDGDNTIIIVVAWTMWLGDWSTAELTVPTSSGLHPAGVDAIGDGQVAALCDGTTCALYAALASDGTATELVAMDNGTVPDGDTVRDLWIIPNDGLTCVFGRGIHCFDGTSWITEVAASADAPLFNDAESLGSASVAVGDLGLVARSGVASWDVSGIAEHPDLLTVAFDGETYLAGDADGALWNPHGWPGPCKIANEGISSLDMRKSISHSDPGGIMGVTTSGRLFSASGPLDDFTGLCFTGQPIGTPVGAMNPCGYGYNYLVLTKSALFGGYSCSVD